MAEIPLTRGKVALIDDADLPLVLGHKWHFFIGKYAGSDIGGRRNKKKILMHRVVLGAPDGIGVDHINGDGLDNRRCNLRLADQHENCANARLRSDNKSGFKGVSFAKSNPANPWVAKIYVRGRGLHLGCFSDPMAAAQVYDATAIKLFGEFARTNRDLGLLRD